jgi:hypothetical protein
MRKKITDERIRKFFWEADELPFDNKASYLLGDLYNYGVSRCIQISGVLKTVFYEFDIYREEDRIITLIVELPINFTVKNLERTIIFLCRTGGLIASNDSETFHKWEKKIKPFNSYDHAKYSALRFLEALRKKMLLNNASGR